MWRQNPQFLLAPAISPVQIAFMPRPETGRKAPDFTLPTNFDAPFRLSDHRGSPVVLFFYPQDDTEGCRIENVEFTRLLPEFDSLGVKILGISPDSLEKHCAFRDRYGLKVPLGADPELRVIKRYGVWGRKKLFGHEYEGLIRTTFLVGPDGKLAGVWPVSRIKGHADKVLAAARQLVGS
jgi:peroxiredoxin Q/BCP